MLCMVPPSPESVKRGTTRAAARRRVGTIRTVGRARFPAVGGKCSLGSSSSCPRGYVERVARPYAILEKKSCSGISAPCLLAEEYSGTLINATVRQGPQKDRPPPSAYRLSYRARVPGGAGMIALTLGLCAGCAVNDRGLVTTRLYENNTAYVLRLDAWGGTPDHEYHRCWPHDRPIEALVRLSQAAACRCSARG